MIARAGIAVALAGSLACSDAKSAGSSKSTPEQVEAFRVCGEAIGRAGQAPPAERARLVASGCAAACPDGFAAYSSGVPDDRLSGRGVDPRALEPCRLFCNKAAESEFSSAPVAERFTRLARKCGLSYFELPEHGEWMLSDTWLVLLRVHEWLRATKRVIRNSEALYAVKEGSEHTHFSLPVPAYAEGVYTLPEATAIQPASAAFYVVVTAGSVSTAAMPVARLRDVIETRPVPGGRFPGTSTTVEQLAAVFSEHVEQLRGLHAHSNTVPASTPLILADRQLPVARVLEISRALSAARIELGVAGNGAYAHAVQVLTTGPSPTLSIDSASPPEPDALRAELSHLDDAPTVGIAVDGTTTVESLVEVLDLLADVRLGSALIVAGG